MYNVRSPTNRRLLEIIDLRLKDRRLDKMFSEKNKTVNQFDVKPKNDEEFLNLGEYFDKYCDGEDIDDKETIVSTIWGFFFFDSDYGKSGAIITDNCYVYIPKHQVKIFEDIAENPKEVQAVKEGKMGFSIRPYKKKLKKSTKQCYAMEFCDINRK